MNCACTAYFTNNTEQERYCPYRDGFYNPNGVCPLILSLQSLARLTGQSAGGFDNYPGNTVSVIRAGNKTLVIRTFDTLIDENTMIFFLDMPGIDLTPTDLIAFAKQVYEEYRSNPSRYLEHSPIDPTEITAFFDVFEECIETIEKIVNGE